jgi:hypothetical protein
VHGDVVIAVDLNLHPLLLFLDHGGWMRLWVVEWPEVGC